MFPHRANCLFGGAFPLRNGYFPTPEFCSSSRLSGAFRDGHGNLECLDPAPFVRSFAQGGATSYIGWPKGKAKLIWRSELRVPGATALSNLNKPQCF